MGMTIDRAIKQLETYTIPCGKYKEAYDLAIDTMCKYQKIEQIIDDWEHDVYPTSDDALDDIERVVENGNDNN